MKFGRMSAEDYRKLMASGEVPQNGQPQNKMHNIKTTVDGITFDSKLEARRYGELRAMLRAGEIEDLRMHPTFEVQMGFTDLRGVRNRAIHYEADFYYIETATGRVVVEDTKGYETDVFALKRKLFAATYPQYELRVIK